MKATNLLLISIISILSISCANSQKVVYANSANELNLNQQCLLSHSKEIYQSGNNKILLPSELNVLFGDSTATQNMVAQPIWDNAYFMKDREEDVLIIPMKASHNNMELFSDLIVVKNYSRYSAMVSTYLVCKTEAATEYFQIESNVKGEFYRARVLDEKNNVIAIYGVQEYSIPYGVEGDKYFAEKRYSITRDNILYNNDWRRAMSPGIINRSGKKILL